ncbi:TrmH family RNA methyltransferase [Paraconexibacter algicola]|uniref:rRNA methyltransferase n=1 Tax=Paraconexibacter algicola TaxID=2133960 RepID=A0A2T4UF51_9ACTN|nr:TrmH family RNA methyltransferase [Paraconexibacter algicola]PTL56405.1 rRNA methyltransferase [Paraconexibacter algicola]
MDDVLLEGLHALKHARRFGAAVTDVRVAARPAALELAATLAPDLVPLLQAADEVGEAGIAAATARPVPTGVLARARHPRPTLEDALRAPGPVVLLDDPRDPGNVGAAVRVAAAAGAAAVLVVGRLDPWHPVCLRGGAGLQFAQPVLRLDALPDDLAGRPLVALDADGDRRLADEPAGPPAPVLAFGTERHGLGAAVRARADRTVAIPMRAGVSSLNLATSVAAVLYGRPGAAG